MNTSQSNIANKPKLLDKVRLTLRANHYSRKTEEACNVWINKFNSLIMALAKKVIKK
ncbi:MAG: hypothetical protein QHH13_09565 [Melioribacter sp.]|uniref:hypothetical protein n=1 Tax=Rosettibacter primus TaxID=3111523 RepID=UPI00247DFA40|nr:hypothetical protein [Melioribacter sp.]